MMLLGPQRALTPLHIEKVEIWSGVTDALQTHWRTLKDRATDMNFVTTAATGGRVKFLSAV